MLSELEGLQESDETVYGQPTVSFTIRTRSESGNILTEREYSFSYAKEWDKWTFQEFEEKQTEDTGGISDRNWRRTRHILWSDVNDTPEIDVPPEVGQRLKEAINADSVTIQIPRGGLNDSWMETIATYE